MENVVLQEAKTVAIQPRLIPGDTDILKVVQANALATSVQDMTLLERRIILLALAVINRSDQELPYVRIYTSDIKRTFGVAYNSLGAELNEATGKLMTRYAVFLRTRHGSYSKISWVNEVHFTSGLDSEDGMSYIDIQLHPAISRYVLQLTGRFFSVPVGVLARFRSMYSLRLCEILMAESRGGKVRQVNFDLPELKEILGCNTKAYHNFSNFRQRVLEPSQTENKEAGFLTFDWETINRGRQVIGLKFSVQVNHGAMSIDDFREFESQDQDIRRLALENSMRESGFTENPRAYTDRLGVDLVERIYTECRQVQMQNKGTKSEIRNFGGFLHSQLKQALENPPPAKGAIADDGFEHLTPQQLQAVADRLVQALAAARLEYVMQRWAELGEGEQNALRERMMRELDEWTLAALRKAGGEEGVAFHSAIRRILEAEGLTYPAPLASIRAFVSDDGLAKYRPDLRQKILRYAEEAE
jgi:plasmid replication initiation protein